MPLEPYNYGDVKAALIDSNWDIEAAQKELRRRGKVLASKKSSRMAAEGLLALAQNENKAAIIELNCETDFVARYLSILFFGVGGFCSVGFFSNNSKGRKRISSSLSFSMVADRNRC